MFHDNYAALYNRYKVTGATITFVSLDNHVVNTVYVPAIDGTTGTSVESYAGNQRAVRMFILADNDAADVSGSIDTLIEEGNKKFRWCYAPQTTSGRMHKLRMAGQPHKMHQCPKNDDQLAALFGAGPARESYFICGVDSFPNGNSTVMNFQVIITYKVKVFDLIRTQTQN